MPDTIPDRCPPVHPAAPLRRPRSAVPHELATLTEILTSEQHQKPAVVAILGADPIYRLHVARGLAPTHCLSLIDTFSGDALAPTDALARWESTTTDEIDANQCHTAILGLTGTRTDPVHAHEEREALRKLIAAIEKNRLHLILLSESAESIPAWLRTRVVAAVRIEPAPDDIRSAHVEHMRLHDVDRAIAQRALDRDAPIGQITKLCQTFPSLEPDTAVELAVAAADALDQQPPERAVPPRYDPALINAEIIDDTPFDLPTMIDKLVASEDRAILLALVGDPGTGKSQFALDLARRLGYRPFEVKAKDILGMYVGDNEAKTSGVFARAIRRREALIINEADSVLPPRDGAEHLWQISMVNTFLDELDHHPMPVIMTFNDTDRIDPAALDRFWLRIRFNPLTAEQFGPACLSIFGRALDGPAIAGTTLRHLAQIKRQVFVRGLDTDAAILAAIHARVPEARPTMGFGRE